MRYFTIPITVRMRKETLDDIDYLIERYPEKYVNLSHVVRCAIIHLVNQKYQEEEDEVKRLKIKRKR